MDNWFWGERVDALTSRSFEGFIPYPNRIPEFSFKPVIVTGAAGGPTIITQALLLLTHIIDDGMLPVEALAEPRFHHQWNPEELKIEKAFGEGTLNRVKALGHDLAESSGFGACQAIFFDGKKNLFYPANDPRVPGKADGK